MSKLRKLSNVVSALILVPIFAIFSGCSSQCEVDRKDSHKFKDYSGGVLTSICVDSDCQNPGYTPTNRNFQKVVSVTGKAVADWQVFEATTDVTENAEFNGIAFLNGQMIERFHYGSTNCEVTSSPTSMNDLTASYNRIPLTFPPKEGVTEVHLSWGTGYGDEADYVFGNFFAAADPQTPAYVRNYPALSDGEDSIGYGIPMKGCNEDDYDYTNPPPDRGKSWGDFRNFIAVKLVVPISASFLEMCSPVRGD